MHATDATNASRTLLFNIRSGAWDEELLRLFEVPPSLLPEVRDTAGEFGTARPSISATAWLFSPSPATSKPRSSARPA